jgi:competence protein ComEA
VVVHVVGAVASPGVVRLPSGSRVGDAITAVGGARTTKALASVNLARVLVDGEQIVVDSAGLAATGGRSGVALVSLNTADAVELEALPGVGPVLAQRIVEWRTTHGPFHSIDELSEVTGIGAALMGDLKNRVRL